MHLICKSIGLFLFVAHNIEDCARESMKFEMRKYDFEVVLEELRGNQNALEMAQVKAADLITTETGFSCTQEPLSITQLTSTQRQSARRCAGYSEVDQLNEEIDLLEHLNIDQHGNLQDTIDPPINADIQDVVNALKFLAERFSRLLLWFETKDPREKYTFTPKELIDEYHKAKFIDRSIINIHKPATYVLKFVFNDYISFSYYCRKNQPATKRGVIQDASNLRKALAKCFLNYPDLIKFTDETVKFLENFDL